MDLTKNYYNTCFDTKCYDVGKRKLSEKLNDYGGGGTHITQAFQNLNFLLSIYIIQNRKIQKHAYHCDFCFRRIGWYKWVG